MPTMLPALPATFGRLTDVFVSALGAITGNDNRLGFRSAKRVCVIMVDGLGTANLKFASGHAPFLNSALATSKGISCAFPSTTATSLTSFATGLHAGEHRLIGYQVFDRQENRSANLLTGWGSLQEPFSWQPEQTISQRAHSSGVASYVIGPAEYEGSGFTMVTMREAKYLGAKSIADRMDAARKLLHAKEDCLIYLYAPELDQTAHAFGSMSDRWLNRIEELDAAVKKLVGNLPVGAAVALTADHGIIDVPHNSHLFVDEVLSDGEAIYVGGDPRVNFIYLSDPESAAATALKLRKFFGDFALVLTQSELANSLLYKTLTMESEKLLPDVMLLSKKRIALYHRGFAKPQSLKMIGQHGALTHEEMSIPLLTWGNFS